MNDALVVVDPKDAALRRYVVGGGAPLLTHEAVWPEAGGPVSFTVDVVEDFRTRPPERFRITAPPYQPPPPAGGTPAAGAMPAAEGVAA